MSDPPPTTTDPHEIEKFSTRADAWWNEDGAFKPLHKLNPVRLAYIREHALRHFGRDGLARQPLTGLTVLDIGCGGGLLSEPLARLGAKVTGIDAGELTISAARRHAETAELAIDYRIATAEALAEEELAFDIVLNMEVIEHVADAALYMASCARLTAPSGLLFSATINRTARALLFAKWAAEYLLRWLPRGTHDWNKFVTPDELTTLLGRGALTVLDQTGLVYRPVTDDWVRSRDLGVNYMMLATRRIEARSGKRLDTRV